MKKYSVHIIWAVLAILSLVGGYIYGRSTASPFANRAGFTGTGGAAGSFAGRRTGASGGFTTGMITAMDSSTITLQLPNGNSQVIFYSSSTSVTEPTTVSVSVLKTGSNVMIGGSQNSDGSLTAQSIQVRSATGARPAGQ